MDSLAVARRAPLVSREPDAGPVTIPLTCTCPQRPYPHGVFVHNQLVREARGRMEWPWSLIKA